mgnify:CR=1 FL=1
MDRKLHPGLPGLRRPFSRAIERAKDGRGVERRNGPRRGAGTAPRAMFGSSDESRERRRWNRVKRDRHATSPSTASVDAPLDPAERCARYRARGRECSLSHGATSSAKDRQRAAYLVILRDRRYPTSEARSLATSPPCSCPASTSSGRPSALRRGCRQGSPPRRRGGRRSGRRGQPEPRRGQPESRRGKSPVGDVLSGCQPFGPSRSVGPQPPAGGARRDPLALRSDQP